MAKKKSKPIEPDIIEESIGEPIENEEPVEVVEEVNEPIEEKTETVVDDNQFLYTQLKMINKISNAAKAKRLAARVLRNRKR